MGVLHLTSAATTSQRALLLALWWGADDSVAPARWAGTGVPGASAGRTIMGEDEPHRVDDPAGLSGVSTLGELLATWAAAPGPRAACFPIPGDPCGVPAEAAAEAIVAGECLLGHAPDGTPFAAVPTVTSFGSPLEPGTMVSWRLTPVEPWLPRIAATVGTVPEASTRLRQAVVGAAAALERLDVASAITSDGPDVRHSSPPPLPPSMEPAAVRLLIDALRMLTIAEAALAADSAAITASQLVERQAVLVDLHHAARLALSAATLGQTTLG